MRTALPPTDPIDVDGPLGGPRPRRRSLAWRILGAVVLIAAATALVARSASDDATDVATTPTTGPARTATDSSTTSIAVPPSDARAALWPFRGSGTRFATAEEAARSFAREFLRFREPVMGSFMAGDLRSGEIEVRASSSGPATVVMVRQLDGPGSWSVVGADTADIEVETPTAGDVLTSPTVVSGRALAFEGHVNVEVRQDGELGAIGAGFVTGGGDVPRRFEGQIPFETPGATMGAIVFFTDSAENGEVWSAEVVRVTFRSTDADAAACGSVLPTRPTLEASEMEVKAYFGCGDEGRIFPVYRAVPRSPTPLRAALEVLLQGPTSAEADAGITSFFNPATAGALRAATIADGHAVIDLADVRRVIPNASSSAGSATLLAQLDATVFQFRSIESVEYRIAGSCDTFNEWLQIGGCAPRSRPASSD